MRLVVLCRLLFLISFWLLRFLPSAASRPFEKNRLFRPTTVHEGPRVSPRMLGQLLSVFVLFSSAVPSLCPSAALSLSVLSIFSILSPFLPWRPLRCRLSVSCEAQVAWLVRPGACFGRADQGRTCIPGARRCFAVQWPSRLSLPPWRSPADPCRTCATGTFRSCESRRGLSCGAAK